MDQTWAQHFLQHKCAAVLKSLTSYDPMTVELKNSNESPSIVGSFNVIVTCNSRLTVHLEGDTDAWRRRLVIINYHKPKPEKVITDLDHRFWRPRLPVFSTGCLKDSQNSELTIGSCT